MKFRFKSEVMYNDFLGMLNNELEIFGVNPHSTQAVIELFEDIGFVEFEAELCGYDMISVNGVDLFEDMDSFIMFEDEIATYLDIVE